MITQSLQEEKQTILKLLSHVLGTVENLQFLKELDFEVGKEFNKKWEGKLKSLSYIINNYLHQEFPIVVIGRWNSGKSTLINAILGEEILPSANREMTSLLTKVRYGESEDAIVHFHGERHKIIQTSEIENYINLRGSRYSKNVKQIDVKCKNSLLRGGFCIWDTPGLGSINDLNNDIAFDVIPKAHAIILTFSGSDVGGKDNLNLIEYIFTLNCESLSNVIFVINKCDILSEKEKQEAQESLMELIDIARNHVNMEEVDVHICMLSAYKELKHQQYRKRVISKTDLLNDEILRFFSANEIESIHQDSGFDNFVKILDKSILKSGNKKKITDGLFAVIQSILSDLRRDYCSIYNDINKSNSHTKEQFMKSLQKSRDIEIRINEKALEKVDIFSRKIDVLQPLKEYNMQHVNRLIDSIYEELCRYVDITPYEEISKDKYKDLNQQINMVSTKLSINWLGDIRKEFDSEWHEMIIAIAGIMEKNNKEIIVELTQDNIEEIELEINEVRVKEDFSRANYTQSLVTAVSVGSGLFVIGNGLVPVIGGVLAGIAGGVIALIVSKVSQTSEDIRKENLKNNLKIQLLGYADMYRKILENLRLQYEDSVNQLRDYLNISLENVKREKECLIENYDATKERNEEIKEKLTADIRAIEELMPQVRLVFQKYRQ